MIEVKIPMEIEDYQGKIIAGLSVRQLAFGALAAVSAVPVFLIFNHFNRDIALYGAMFAAAPSVLMGFVRKNGYTFDKFIKIWIKAMFTTGKRQYETDGSETVPTEIVSVYRIYGEQEKNEGENTENDNKQKRRKAKRAKTRPRAETRYVKVTKKDIKRARKTALAYIKGTGRKDKTKKRKSQEETQKDGCSALGTGGNTLQKNV